MNVQDLLDKKDIRYMPKGRDFLVRCINPEHEDRNPSMRVDQITGVFQCFSCEYKGNLFTHFGEKANQLQLKRELLKKRISEKRADSIGLSFPKSAVPYIGNWRNIKPETYKRFEAFNSVDKDHASRIVFPVRDMSERIVAFNGRHTAQGIPKYMITPAGARMPLFPIVQPIQGSVVLVEGIFDMINLHDKGLENVVCCFGTRNIDIDKLKLLKMQGITAVDILFDPDEAGQEAAVKLGEMCDSAEILHKNITIPRSLGDAGALTIEKVKQLKEQLYG